MLFNSLKLVDSGTIKGTYDGVEADYDYYQFDGKSSFSTKEISIQVSYLEGDPKPFTGDMIAYGEWGDLYEGDLLPLVDYLIKNNLEIRKIDRNRLKKRIEKVNV